MDRKSLTLSELAVLTNSKLVGDPNHRITNVADLNKASSTDASFLGNMRYEQAMRKSAAGVIFIDEATALVEDRNFLISENPSRAFQQTLEALLVLDSEMTAFQRIHPTAVVHPTVKIGKDVNIGPCAVIDKEVTVGDRSSIGAGCYLGPGVKLGEDCLLHPNVTIRERCVLGNRVIIQPGTVIGSCGFGYTTDKKGHHTKLHHVGDVVIEDDVEIGANTVIERARFQTTRIGIGTKISNLIIIGHNVVLGKHNLLVGQTGIAGSSETGNHVILAAQVGVAGHIKIADNVILAARSGVSKSIAKPGRYAGVPATPLQEHNRHSVHVRNIGSYVHEVQELKKRLASLEQNLLGKTFESKIEETEQ